MEIEFCIQDPSHPGTTYLFEAIIRAAVGATTWRGIYAFASRDGVDWLFEDPVINQLVNGGIEVDLLVGLDAVTNRRTLERLQELEQLNEHFRPQVLWNDFSWLFHPTISDFTYPDGGRTVIGGSGNLTPGGLMNNVEGYTVISADHEEQLNVAALDEFLQRHADAIRVIDDAALERAEQNVITRRGSGIRMTRPPPRRRIPRLVPRHGEGGPVRADRILIAQVPRAGSRWSQVHFNGEVVQRYFRITDLAAQRIYLTRVMSDGTRSDIEVRQCLLSNTNRNHRIEFGAATGIAYPADRPVLVLRERQVRVFDYMLVLPDHDGYTQLVGLTNELPSVGSGVPRVISELARLEQAWAECPLLTSGDVENEIM